MSGRQNQQWHRRNQLLTTTFRCGIILLLIYEQVSQCETCTGAQKGPSSSSEQSHRLLVRVEPVAINRDSDELVARAKIDFDTYLKPERCDFSTLTIRRYDTATKALEPLRSSSQRPVRIYDLSIPWEFPERQGYAHGNNGTGLPATRLKGGGRFLPILGDGRQVYVAWAHQQQSRQPTYYAICFDALPPGTPLKAAVPGFLGDGSNRCEPDAPSFFPLYHSRVDIADLNGDALFDLVVGNMNGTILWYPNSGSSTAPRFTMAKLIVTDDGEPLDIGYSSAPRVVDWDSDGDLDLIVGAEKESFVFFRNLGTVSKPCFQLQGLLEAGGEPIRVPRSPCEEDPEGKIFPYDYYPVPDIVDWDGDGDQDLLAGGYITGRIWLYENIENVRHAEPELVFRGALQADGRDLDVTWMASPCAADFDSDGDLDLISGAMQVTDGLGDKSDPERFLWYYENVGSRESPQLTLRSFPVKGHFRHGALATPRVVDFNNDGLLDLIVSASRDLFLIANVGSSDKPLFDATAEPMKATWGNAPLRFQQLVDYNGDNWPDLFGGAPVQDNMPFFEGTTITIADWRNGHRYSGETVVRLLGQQERIKHSTPRGDAWDYRTLADLNGDGLMDVLAGVHDGHIWFHQNSGRPEQASLDVEGVRLQLASGELLRVGLAPSPEDNNAFDDLQGARTTLSTSDFNRDGELDLLVCDTFGVVRLFLQRRGDEVAFEAPVELARAQKIRMAAQPIDWNGDGWDDVLATYASEHTYLLINRAEHGTAAFDEPIPLDLPRYPVSWPLLHVADWNNDGDEDILLHYGTMLRYIERSFADHGYVPATIVAHDRK